MAHRASPFSGARVLAALALAFTTLLTGCDLLDLGGDWSATDDVCTNVPGHPCQPPPAP